MCVRTDGVKDSEKGLLSAYLVDDDDDLRGVGPEPVGAVDGLLPVRRVVLDRRLGVVVQRLRRRTRARLRGAQISRLEMRPGSGFLGTGSCRG